MLKFMSWALVALGALVVGPAAGYAEVAPATENTAAPAGVPVEPKVINPAVVVPPPSGAVPANEPAPPAGDSKANAPAPTASEPPKAAEAVKPAPLPDPTMTVSIDLGSQRMTVRENGANVYSWAVSSGTASYPTPRGTFRPQWTAKMWYSRKYDNAPMPNAVFIHGGVAIHATYATGMLGSPASHGCIRLSPANAATFYKLVHKHGLKKVQVAVYGTPKWRAPAVARRDDRRRYAEQDNSWFWGGGNSFYEQDYPPPSGKRYYRGSDNGYYVKTSRGYRRVDRESVRGARRGYSNEYGSGYGNGW